VPGLRPNLAIVTLVVEIAWLVVAIAAYESELGDNVHSRADLGGAGDRRRRRGLADRAGSARARAGAAGSGPAACACHAASAARGRLA
jgi:hypothetical protein